MTQYHECLQTGDSARGTRPPPTTHSSPHSVNMWTAASNQHGPSAPDRTTIKLTLRCLFTQFKQFLPFNTWPAGLQRHRSGSNKITVFIELMKHPPSTCVLGITCSWWEISDKSTRLNWTVIRDYSHLRRSRLCPTWHDKASNCPIPYHTIIPSKILSLQSAGTSPLYIIQSLFQSD